MSTLYISDLDGTLLRSDETTSEYTNRTLNELTKQGILFSYATARSIVTAKKVTAGLEAKIPVIVYNGAFILDHATGEVLAENFFDAGVHEVLQELFAAGVYPIVYAMIEGKERFSYIESMTSQATRNFIATRNDFRKNPVKSTEELLHGSLFYITCIDEAEKLYPVYQTYQDRYHCIYHQDIYSHEQWLEIMPLTSTKANAILKLKKMLGCDKIVAFGDGINDMEMFRLADESYAVQNAAPELKKIATDVIGSNQEDAVARWLANHCTPRVFNTSRK